MVGSPRSSVLRPPPSDLWRLGLPLALFSILWLDLCHQLSYVWRTNEQYAYGWFVPIFALGLFLKKWPSRPGSEVRSQKSEVSGPLSNSPVVRGPFLLSAFPIPAFALPAFIFLLCLLLLPLRAIHEINQDWSFCSYLLTLTVVALTLYAIHLAAPPPVVSSQWSVVSSPVVRSPAAPISPTSASSDSQPSTLNSQPSSSPWSVVSSQWSLLSPWVKHFAFPICFILVAVNWPYRIENSLKHRMMNAVAGLTVEIAGWLNIPALRHGNVIELASGSVGVEDACSGIRSLQSTIMAALFLGELYLFRWQNRLLLVAIGVPLAFSFNIARTLFLTWQASSAGGAAVAKWHDSAGLTISMVCFGCLWLIAVILSKRTTGVETKDQGPLTSAAAASLSAGGEGRGEVASALSSQWSVVRSPRSFMLLVGLWSIVTIAATEAWYRAHETDPAQTVRWSAHFPTNSPSARRIPLDKEIKQVLKFDQGDSLAWEEPDGTKWSAHWFRWRAGEATSRMAARDHRPEICLPSSGSTLKADLGIRYLPAHGLELPFRAYTFENAGRELYVFFCLWEDGAEKQSGLGRSQYLDRLDSVLAGKRRLGQQTFEIVVSGYSSMAEAEQAVRQRLPGLIQLGSAPNAPNTQ